LKHSRFGLTALQRYFGEPLWEAALGSSFGKLSGTILRNNYFEEQQLWGAAFGVTLQTTSGSSSQQQLWGALSSLGKQQTHTNTFGGEQLSGTILGYRLEESQLWGNSFGQQLGGTTLGSSFGERLWGAVSDNFPEQL